MLSESRFIAAAALALLAWQGDAGAQQPNAAGTAAAAPTAPAIAIRCIGVMDRGVAETWAAAPASAPASASPPSPVFHCPDVHGPGQMLTGSGDILVVIDKSNLAGIQKYESEKSVRMTLFVNGVDLGDDAEHVATEINGGDAVLRYRIRPGDQSRQLWSALYRQGRRTYQAHPLRVALGWSGVPATDTAAQATSYQSSPHYIRITSLGALASALALIAGLLWAGVWLAFRLDILRDAKFPAPLALARTVVAYGARHSNDPGARDTALRMVSADYAARLSTPQDEARLKALVAAAKSGQIDPATDMTDLALGTVLSADPKLDMRPTFSLSKVQFGLWVLFAVAAGLFLWIVYGDLPKIDGSLLALLGLSAGVTGLAWAADSGNQAVSYRPTGGIFDDLVTDWQGQHQIHRLQAVLVNAMLLCVGFLHVAKHLTYPIFDETWLAFLGISGVAYAGGKQLAEKR